MGKPSFDDYAFKQQMPSTTAFPILRTNSYGRMMIGAQMNTHDRLIRNAKGRTDCYLEKRAEDQMEYNRMLEKWRPGYNELQKKARDDEILADLIASATHRCETELDEHIKLFKKNRAKNPRYKPGWLESYVNGKNMAVHEELLRKAGPRIDNNAPKKAMQFREFLKSCKYTKGGFLRPSKQRRPKLDSLPGLDGGPRSLSCPPNLGRHHGVPVDACGREKRLNPALVSKYSELLFRKNMDNATNDDVRVLYAQSNDNDVPVPSMHAFIAQQGIDLNEMETDMAATYDMFAEGENVSPFGLGTLHEEDEEELGAPGPHRDRQATGPRTRAQAQEAAQEAAQEVAQEVRTEERHSNGADGSEQGLRVDVGEETLGRRGRRAEAPRGTREELSLAGDREEVVWEKMSDGAHREGVPAGRRSLSPNSSPGPATGDSDQLAVKVSSEAAVHTTGLD